MWTRNEENFEGETTRAGIAKLRLHVDQVLLREARGLREPMLDPNTLCIQEREEPATCGAIPHEHRGGHDFREGVCEHDLRRDVQDAPKTP